MPFDFLNEFSVSDFIAAIAVLVSIVGLAISIRGNHSKLSVYQRVDPILSAAYRKKDFISPDIEIKCKDSIIADPYLLKLDIVYTGKEALIAPCIRIGSSEDIALFPGKLTNVPDGYEDLWSIKKIDSFTCDLELKHINPKQSFSACFIMENMPTKRVSISCTMPNLEVYESGYINNKLESNKLFLTRSNLFLLCITGILGGTAQIWSRYVLYLSRLINGYIPAVYSVPFVLTTFILAIFFNMFGFPSITASWVSNHEKRHGTMAGIVLLCILSIYPLALEFHSILAAILQFIGGCVVVFLLAVLIRLLTVEFEHRKF